MAAIAQSKKTAPKGTAPSLADQKRKPPSSVEISSNTERTTIESDQPGERTDSQKSNKPKLNIDGQITHLKAKGVKFERCSEEKAARYLSDGCSFCELTSYRKLFAKHQGGKHDGKYVNLDFAQLAAFAELDEILREALFNMTRHIEHSHKVNLNRSIAEKEDEDGYAIVNDYMASLAPKDRRYRETELERNGRSRYTKPLYEKHKQNMPSWVFLELVSFGALIDFIRFCGVRWNDKHLEQSHYDLKKVKSVRNCTAHSSCIINTFAEGVNSQRTTSRETLEIVADLRLSKPTRRKWLRNTATQEIAITLVRYVRDVPDCPARERDTRKLEEFFNKVKEADELLPKTGPDATATAAISFIRSLTKSLRLID